MSYRLIGHTMFRDRVHPFVESRVKFGDETLLPSGLACSEKIFRFVQGVLCIWSPRSTIRRKKVKGRPTTIRRLNARMLFRRRYALKNATREGFPGGWRNAIAGSSCSMYSSSHSVGQSRSKLHHNRQFHSELHIIFANGSLIVLHRTRAPESAADNAVIHDQHPESTPP